MGHTLRPKQIQGRSKQLFSNIASDRMHSFMAHEKLPPQSSVQDTEVINSVLKIRTINWTLQWLHEVVTLQHLPYIKSKHF